MTAADLWRMPAEGARCELVEGQLLMMSPAGGRHGRIALKLGRRLGDHVERYDLGQTYAAETGFLLHRDPDTVRAADVAFVTHGRLGAWGDEPGYLPLAPNLVAEVVSPADRPAQVADKTRQWLEAGVDAVLVVDPQQRLVQVHRPGRPVAISGESPLDLGDVVSGFRLDVVDLFA